VLEQLLRPIGQAVRFLKDANEFELVPVLMTVQFGTAAGLASGFVPRMGFPIIVLVLANAVTAVPWIVVLQM
jgi:hypothetical protein